MNVGNKNVIVKQKTAIVISPEKGIKSDVAHLKSPPNLIKQYSSTSFKKTPENSNR